MRPTSKRPDSEDRTASSRDRSPVLFVVEDDPATLELLRDVAHEVGWEAYGFTRLADVRASLDGPKPTLIILDDDLPDGRGGDLARELREDRRTADVPLLVCTAAHRMRRAEIRAWAPVLTKPFDITEIEAYLGAAARGRDGGDSYPRVAS